MSMCKLYWLNQNHIMHITCVPKEVNINGGEKLESPTQCIEETQDNKEDDDDTSHQIEGELARREIEDNPEWQ
eukprot:14298431-Ditylum_brightwellii.AAC.1